MTLESLRTYCLSKEFTTEAFPFDNNTLVFKVLDKIFLLTSLNDENLSFNAKCDPEKAIELRENYDFIVPGYHMNKKHWNTVTYNGTNSKLLFELIDHSYSLVLASIPNKTKNSTKSNI